ncbi:WAT1-related protein [Acorus calamus]|uniref:WAT1-related protein n=1 Tax=Acorus calamus TaxID=4465 RepID=A0AAV9EB93_ACOCL|nr:WAT1-related protein [Acorus calamus]
MDSMKPYLVLIIIRSIYAGMSMLSKAAFNYGMSTYVFVFYRQCFAFIFLASFALIFERKTAPPLRFKTFLKVFLLAFIGGTFSLNMFGLGISYTSATLASATTSMTPMITFFLSTLMRIETVSLKRASRIAKLAGVAVCTVGALTIAFYKGPSLKSFNHHYISSHHNNNRSTTHAMKTWIEGAFLMILCTISWAIWLVFQGNVMKEYPSKLLFSTV